MSNAGSPNLSVSSRIPADEVTGPPASDNRLTSYAGSECTWFASSNTAEQARNANNLPKLKTLDVAVKLIWGKYDPYFPVAVAERRQLQLKSASLTVIPAGHWLQADEPAQVARAMLS